MCARIKPATLDMVAMGERIRQLRDTRTQVEFAAQLGISQSQLSKIESGTLLPSVVVLFRLALDFDRTIDWIVKGG